MEYVEQVSEEDQDQRIFERLPAAFPVRFSDLNSSSTGEARLCDISARGMGMVGGKELSPSTRLELWMNIPDNGQPLYARGEVVWCSAAEGNKYHCGISLDRAELMDLSRIMRIL